MRPGRRSGFEEVDAFFTGAKRAQLDERQSRSMLRDEEADGARPRPLVDLDNGRVTFVEPRSRD